MGPSAIGAGRLFTPALEDEPNASLQDPEQLASFAPEEAEAETTEPEAETKADTPATDNNAARTRERNSSGFYADAGYTRSGDGVFAGLAAVKTAAPEGGEELELLSASAQLGAQTELQAGVARAGDGVEYQGVRASIAGELFTTRVTGGIHNDDDSVGANLSALNTVAGLEVTVAAGGFQVTVGTSISSGMAVSSGERNIDGDATIERCFKGSVGPLTLGFCSEL